MKIKEKFKSLNTNFEDGVIYYHHNINKCEKVADEYAIDFACWLFEDMEITKVKRLLKLFKQYNKMNLPKEL
jgi:hypothetical protein